MKCRPETYSRRSRAKPPRRKTSPVVSRASSNSSKPASPRILPSSAKSTARFVTAISPRACARSTSKAKTARPRRNTRLLAVLGEKFTQAYLVNAIQEVYRLQGVNINDKHIETISRQMMRWVKVEDV